MSVNAENTKKVKVGYSTAPEVFIYQVEENELNLLETGSYGSKYISFAIPLFTMAFAITINFLLNPSLFPEILIAPNITFLFTIMCSFYLISIVIFTIWWCTQRVNVKKIYERIRKRKIAPS